MSKIIYCTTCCKEKSTKSGKIPAIDRYLDGRILQVFDWSKKAKGNFVILSGKYGILAPESPLEWYDKKMEASEIASIAELIYTQLKGKSIQRLLFFTRDTDQYPDWAPYQKAMALACKKLDVILEINRIEYLENGFIYRID